ncbi:unnamed protein product [Acanthoscelides obtectus]|uniref:Uncharacterized protein n=1 Tax=Acanthoscelides obtectus TaxID=200917 RepID=A0A9P0VPJ4_ACAOB|nr:unnamed protein product [Acanthoscelides obtectus]CAK1672326.1 hypothetical protein AOBTE_LOCUS28791 [Acanthoscelides obtectus]
MTLSSGAGDISTAAASPVENFRGRSTPIAREFLCGRDSIGCSTRQLLCDGSGKESTRPAGDRGNLMFLRCLARVVAAPEKWLRRMHMSPLLVQKTPMNK